MIYKPGQMVALSSGAYSGYGFHNIIKIMSEFDMKQKYQEHTDYYNMINCNPSDQDPPLGFGDWLQSLGLAQVIEYEECNTEYDFD